MVSHECSRSSRRICWLGSVRVSRRPGVADEPGAAGTAPFPPGCQAPGPPRCCPDRPTRSAAAHPGPPGSRRRCPTPTWPSALGRPPGRAPRQPDQTRSGVMQRPTSRSPPAHGVPAGNAGVASWSRSRTTMPAGPPWPGRTRPDRPARPGRSPRLGRPRPRRPDGSDTGANREHGIEQHRKNGGGITRADIGRCSRVRSAWFQHRFHNLVLPEPGRRVHGAGDQDLRDFDPAREERGRRGQSEAVT